MSRTPSNKRPAPRPQPRQTSASPSAQRPSNASPTEATPAFPFARTTEDDELRDMFGYGWGV
ncbi:MAG: hypothetical protein IPN03_05790 [Holophagales bacterium]|nr:hypothetical protein [Holophagales bacterium]MBK9373236.1 hypothetical protein [Holophagales bacterium]